MKNFLLILLLISCSSELTKKNLRKSEFNTFELQEDIQIDSKIELFVAFFWPQKILDSEYQIVSKVISHARNIIKIKNDYYESKFEPNCKFEQLDCFCVVNYTCSEDPSDELIAECEVLDEKLLEIDFKLFEMASEIETLKKTLGEFKNNSEWIKTHLDYSSLDVPYLNTNQESFDIPIWREENRSADISDFDLSSSTLTFTIDNNIKSVIDLKRSEYSIQGMGELEEIENGKVTRRGVTFFEVDQTSFSNCN